MKFNQINRRVFGKTSQNHLYHRGQTNRTIDYVHKKYALAYKTCTRPLSKELLSRG